MLRKLIKRRSRTRGFTLLEMLVVVLIIGLILALVVPNIIDKPDEARVKMAQAQLRSFDVALQYYHMHNSHYPSTDQSLEALVEKPSGFPEPRNWGPKPYMNKIPMDPWGNEYIYQLSGTEYSIYSRGSDGEEGGEGVAADIYVKDI